MDILYNACRKITSCPPSRGGGRELVAEISIEETPKKKRRSFLLDDSEAIRDKIRDAKANRGNNRKWLHDLVRKDFPHLDLRGERFELEHSRYTNWCRKQSKDVARPNTSSTAPAAIGGRKNQVHAANRRRNGLPGPSPRCLELREELFAWFVDTIDNVPGRIASVILLCQAAVIAVDLEQEWVEKVLAGTADESKRPVFPKLTYESLLRWRMAFGLSWRTVTLRFKCSRAKILQRIDNFWQNVLRIRWLHYSLEGCRQVLRWFNADEKPVWLHQWRMQRLCNRRAQ